MIDTETDIIEQWPAKLCHVARYVTLGSWLMQRLTWWSRGLPDFATSLVRAHHWQRSSVNLLRLIRSRYRLAINILSVAIVMVKARRQLLPYLTPATSQTRPVASACSRCVCCIGGGGPVSTRVHWKLGSVFTCVHREKEQNTGARQRLLGSRMEHVSTTTIILMDHLWAQTITLTCDRSRIDTLSNLETG